MQDFTGGGIMNCNARDEVGYAPLTIHDNSLFILLSCELLL
jgi:hypothetical protein